MGDVMTGARTAEQILEERLSLVGSGDAWRGPNLKALLAAFAGARAELEADIAALSEEISPGTSVLLLGDYQTVLGPDPYSRDDGTLTVAQLQALLQSRWTETGGARISDFEALGASFGVAVSITEPEPAICGVAVCGDAICSQHTLRFYWIADLSSDNADLIAAIKAATPADTVLVISVNGEWI